MAGEACAGSVRHSGRSSRSVSKRAGVVVMARDGCRTVGLPMLSPRPGRPPMTIICPMTDRMNGPLIVRRSAE